jgi:hypothetical protein
MRPRRKWTPNSAVKELTGPADKSSVVLDTLDTHSHATPALAEDAAAPNAALIAPEYEASYPVASREGEARTFEPALLGVSQTTPHGDRRSHVGKKLGGERRNETQSVSVFSTTAMHSGKGREAHSR